MVIFPSEKIETFFLSIEIFLSRFLKKRTVFVLATAEHFMELCKRDTNFMLVSFLSCMMKYICIKYCVVLLFLFLNINKYFDLFKHFFIRTDYIRTYDL